MDFQALLRAYLTQHIGKKNQRTQYEYARIAAKYFEAWTQHKTRFELKAWHEANAHKPHEANKALGILQAMYGWGQRTGDATGKRALWEGDNLASGIPEHKTYSRERVFTDYELQKFLAYLDFFYPKLSAYLTLLICSACRGCEARAMRWEYIDVEQRCWYKPITKNGRAQRLPLPWQAIQAIQSLPRRDCCPYVFQGERGNHWSESGVNKAWRRAANEMSIRDLRLHDFRRTVATRVYAHTKDYPLVKAILNHFDGGPTAVYVRLNYEYIAKELQANADRLWSLKQEVHDDVQPTARVAQPGLAGDVAHRGADPTPDTVKVMS